MDINYVMDDKINYFGKSKYESCCGNQYFDIFNFENKHIYRLKKTYDSCFW